MPKFIVTASYVTYCTLEVEAETSEQAYEIARDADGGDFETLDGDDWKIEGVREIDQ